MLEVKTVIRSEAELLIKLEVKLVIEWKAGSIIQLGVWLAIKPRPKLANAKKLLVLIVSIIIINININRLYNLIKTYNNKKTSKSLW